MEDEEEPTETDNLERRERMRKLHQEEDEKEVLKEVEAKKKRDASHKWGDV